MSLLFLSMIVLGATAHRLLEATSRKETGALDNAEEHQRILAELEEVHNLRERMLQQGKALSRNSCTCAVIAFATMHPGVRNPLLATACFSCEAVSIINKQRCLLITETASQLKCSSMPALSSNLGAHHACIMSHFLHLLDMTLRIRAHTARAMGHHCLQWQSATAILL